MCCHQRWVRCHRLILAPPPGAATTGSVAITSGCPAAVTTEDLLQASKPDFTHHAPQGDSEIELFFWNPTPRTCVRPVFCAPRRADCFDKWTDNHGDLLFKGGGCRTGSRNRRIKAGFVTSILSVPLPRYFLAKIKSISDSRTYEAASNYGV